MTDTQQYVLITRQPGTRNPETNAYSSPDVTEAELEGAGHLLADGATPTMTFEVVPLQPAKWDSI